jgi:hypothetical protein
MYSRGEYYPPEYYRRCGLAAKQRAAQSTDRRLRFRGMLSFWTDADHYAEDAEPDAHSVLTIAGLRTCERPTAWLGM